MIEEVGLVVEVRDGAALVRTERSSACGHCAAKSACSGLGGGREARVWARDPVGVREGDRVVVAVPEGTVVRASLLIYLIPVLALVGGALLGARLATSLGLSEDLAAAGTGLVLMGAALALARWAGKSAAGPAVVRRA